MFECDFEVVGVEEHGFVSFEVKDNLMDECVDDSTWEVTVIDGEDQGRVHFRLERPEIKFGKVLNLKSKVCWNVVYYIPFVIGLLV